MTNIKEYHAHIYFNSDTETPVRRLYARLQDFGEGRIVLHSISEESRGPHVARMFGIDIAKAEFEAVLGLLLLNHGPHSVLIHPVSSNELLDHTHHALWLELPLNLNLSALVDENYPGILRAIHSPCKPRMRPIKPVPHRKLVDLLTN